MAKAAELQVLADTSDIRGFYQSMKAVWGPFVSHPDQLLASDNTTLLTEKQDLLTRWNEHFRTLLNRTLARTAFTLKSSGAEVLIC